MIDPEWLDDAYDRAIAELSPEWAAIVRVLCELEYERRRDAVATCPEPS